MYGARHVVLGRTVAIKVLRPEYADQSEHRAAFLSEARAHARLDHPGVIRIYDVGMVDEEGAEAMADVAAGAPFIAMERGVGTLEDDLPLRDWTQTSRVLADVLDALAHAHARGVIHRDLKPANLLRVKEVAGARYKLADFGLAHARQWSKDPRISMGATAGTPHYMAPEQVGGQWRDFGPETDLYALGCIAYRLVTGEVPFPGDSLYAIVVQHMGAEVPSLDSRFSVPAGLGAWIGRLLEKAPFDRYRGAADALADLRGLSEHFSDGVDALREWVTPKDGVPVATTILDVELDTAVDSETTVPSIDSFLGTMRAPGGGAKAGDGLGLFDLAEGPLVGRDAELGRLREALDEVVRLGEARAVIIRGPAGVGLSRLGQAFATRVHELALAYVARSVHTPSGAPHEGLAGMLEMHFATWGLDVADVRERVTERLESVGVEDAYVVGAAVTQIIGRSRVETTATAPLHRFRTSRERAFLVDAALRAGHDDRPTVYFLDDVQWAREALECVRDLLDRDGPRLFVLALRDDEPVGGLVAALLEEIGGRPTTRTLRLDAPSETDVRELVGTLLEIQSGTADVIASESPADYRFVRQLVGYLLDSGGLSVDSGGFRLELNYARMPRDWDALWRARLQRALADAGADAVALLPFELAATLGRYPEPREYEAALREAALRPSEHLFDLMVHKGLLVTRGDGWGFAYESLVDFFRERAVDAGRAAGWHRICARVILEAGVTWRRQRRAGLHLLDAGDAEAALLPLREAIREAVAIDAELARRLLRRWDAAIEELGLTDEDERYIDGLLLHAALCHASGNDARMQKYVDEALRASRAAGYLAGEAWALTRSGQLAMDGGDLEFAVDRFHRADAAFGRSDDDAGRAATLLSQGFAMMRLGRTDESIASYREAMKIAERLGDADRLATVTGYLAYTHVVRGEYETARTLTRQVIDQARAVGNRSMEFESMSTLAEIARMNAEYDEAREFLTETLRWRRRLGYRDVAVSELNLALIEIGAGRLATARRILEPLEEKLVALGMEGRLPLVLTAKAVCELADGNLDGWQHYWGRVSPAVEGGEFVHVDVMWLAQRGAECARRAGLDDVAEMLVALGRQQAAALGRPS